MIRSLIFFLFLVTQIYAQIIETPNFGELKKYGDAETLIVLDIDDTLLVPVQMLGSDVWFLHRINEHEKCGIESTKAFEKALREWQAVRHLTQVEVVEEGTAPLIDQMQRDKVMIMGLTTQGLQMTRCTLEQLCHLNIDLSKTAPSSKEHHFMNRLGVLYRQGVLFTAGTPKGPALMKFLEIIQHKPKRIVFINDKEKHLHDVWEEVKKHPIEFVGLRYSFSDERIKAFDPKVAECQWKNSTLDHILSDEEARLLLEN